MKVVWTEQAFIRLAEIQDYVAADSPGAAAQLLERLIELAEAVARFPASGRRLPELPRTSFREVIEGNYRIVYRVRGRVLEINTVFEGHRQLPADDLPPPE